MPRSYRWKVLLAGVGAVVVVAGALLAVSASDNPSSPPFGLDSHGRPVPVVSATAQAVARDLETGDSAALATIGGSGETADATATIALIGHHPNLRGVHLRRRRVRRDKRHLRRAVHFAEAPPRRPQFGLGEWPLGHEPVRAAPSDHTVRAPTNPRDSAVPQVSRTVMRVRAAHLGSAQLVRRPTLGLGTR